MPDSPTDIVDLDIQSELDGLRLLVEETDGSVIAFVRYRRVTEREAGVRYLKEQLSLPVEERTLSDEQQNPLTLLNDLPAERRCVQFYDLEDALPDITGYLNLNREAYAEVSHALVFWVGEHGLREVAQNAPDFWSWRSGVFDVRSDDPGFSQSVSQMALMDDVQFTDRGDLERRADLYEGLIQEYEGEDEEYAAQLRLKLSSVSDMLRNLERAEEAARDALVYAEDEMEDGILARSYYLLGKVALKQREFGEAKERLEKASKIAERLDDKHLAASIYHGLSWLAQERPEMEGAEQWAKRSAELFERLGDEQGIATAYHQLGIVAEQQGQLLEAEQWYQKSLEIKERLRDKHGKAMTYHQLGRVAEKRRDLQEAKKWLNKSAEITERLDDEHGTAMAYLGLGVVAQERGELREAEEWYRESTEIFEYLDDKHSVAKTSLQRAKLSRKREDFLDSGERFLQAVDEFGFLNDTQSAKQAVKDFAVTFDKAPSDVEDELRECWKDAGFPEDGLYDLLDQITGT